MNNYRGLKAAVICPHSKWALAQLVFDIATSEAHTLFFEQRKFTSKNNDYDCRMRLSPLGVEPISAALTPWKLAFTENGLQPNFVF